MILLGLFIAIFVLIWNKYTHVYIYIILYKMSLTLFFIVLSVAIGYLLYDTFKKSKQKASKTSETASNKLKINYTRECTILDTLNK